jgi:hypothetical protein
VTAGERISPAVREVVRRVRTRRHSETPRPAQGHSSLLVLRSGSSASRGMTRLAVRPRSSMSTGRTVPTAVTLRPCGPLTGTASTMMIGMRVPIPSEDRDQRLDSGDEAYLRLRRLYTDRKRHDARR